MKLCHHYVMKKYFTLNPYAQSRKSECGNVFFFIMLGIVLFGALSFTVVNSSKNIDQTLLDNEKAKISQAEIDNYTADIRAGVAALKLDGCSVIDYTPPADQTGSDFSCHLFHGDGGALAYRDLGLGLGCNLVSMEIGENCNGLIYAGALGMTRLYTTVSDLGQFNWNNGASNFFLTGATSTTDGVSNTNILVGLVNSASPYKAASSCRALGAEWYLPERDELNVLYINRTSIGGFNETVSFPEGSYWSSTEASANNARRHRFHDNEQNVDIGKAGGLSVRCVRRD
jgi:hypothetical protein